MAYLSYLGAHWSLILAVTVAVIALAAAGFFLKNWKVALAAIVVLGAGLAYQAIDLEGYKRRVAEEAQAEVKVLQGRLDALQHVAAEDKLRAIADNEAIARLEILVHETPKNDSACLDADAARRVRAIH